MVKESKERIEATPPWEHIVASGLAKLGYKEVESMTVTPSGSSIDLLMQYEGQLIGVEVKARAVEPEDLRGAIDVRSSLGLDNMMVVSNKDFGEDTRRVAEEHGIRLAKIDDILRWMDEAKIPTTESRADISNLANFIKTHPEPKKNLLEEFNTSLRSALEAETNKDKGESLEGLAQILIDMIEGLDVIEKNVNTETEEIDLLVKNESPLPFWMRLPNPFLVECKNWSKPVGAKEIRDFKGKMDEISFRIMIAINGVTGKGERDAAKGVIRDARKQKNHIVILDKEDLGDIAKGMHPAEKINEKFYELYRL